MIFLLYITAHALDDDYEEFSGDFDNKYEEDKGEESASKPDEEEVWLNALEQGRLHEVDDELKKIKDPKLMTARQVSCLKCSFIRFYQ